MGMGKKEKPHPRAELWAAFPSPLERVVKCFSYSG